jgi:hypothetical protein
VLSYDQHARDAELAVITCTLRRNAKVLPSSMRSACRARICLYTQRMIVGRPLAAKQSKRCGL